MLLKLKIIITTSLEVILAVSTGTGKRLFLRPDIVRTGDSGQQPIQTKLGIRDSG
jgi:hypothetical protein